MTPRAWRGRRVLVTGQTGFKGAWLALWLESLGAEVGAVGLAPDSDPNLFEILAPWPALTSTIGDLRDPAVARAAVAGAAPEVIFHLAAQAIVRRGYAEPAATFETNVMATVNLLEAARAAPSVRAVVVVTSDKVYRNDGAGRAFTEDDPLGGCDPYSASKAAQEAVSAAYRESVFRPAGVGLGCARAGNVVGGGDWGPDRLVPDFMRAVAGGAALRVRNPGAVRPWQHVLEPLAGYLLYAERLIAGGTAPGALNFGPAADDAWPVGRLADGLAGRWGDGAAWRADADQHPPEAALLTLDATRAGESLGWRPRLALDEALDWIVAWHRAHAAGADMRAHSLADIARYRELAA